MVPYHKKKALRIARKGVAGRRPDGRKRGLGNRAPMVLPDGPNQCWPQEREVKWH